MPKEASKDIELHFDTAHGDRLLAVISRGCSCIHYSGHRDKNHLLFEDDFGKMCWYHVNDLRDLIYCDNAVPCCFVFVLACRSCHAGDTFVKAGVPHVVCCKKNVELKDGAAHAFTKHFYKSIIMGKMVKESFEDGCKGVLVKYKKEEKDKFLLLPENSNHDILLFKARSIEKWPRCEQVVGDSETNPEDLDLETQNKLQKSHSPKLPEKF